MDIDPALVDWEKAASVTLTAPAGYFETSADFRRARNAYRRRLERRGLFGAGLWIVEWHESGSPHMHFIFFQVGQTDGVYSVRPLVDCWLDVVKGAERWGQDASWIADRRKWLKYLAKHGGRATEHVQRMGPGPWDESSGRMWGCWGDMPVVEPVVIPVRADDFYAARRVAQRMMLSGARGCGSKVAVKWDSTNADMEWSMRKVKRRRRAIRRARKAGRSRGRITKLESTEDRPAYHRAVGAVAPVVVWRDEADEFWASISSLFPGLAERVESGRSKVEIIPF